MKEAKRQSSAWGAPGPFTVAGNRAGWAVQREDLVMRLVTALIFLATILIADNSSSYAQSDSEDVKVVIAAYHAALGALNAGKMDPLWAHDDTVMLVEPFDKVISLGWDAVKKTFDKEFGQLAELKVTQADGPHIQVRGNVAWYTGMTNASVEFKEGPSVENAPTFEAGVFEKRDGHWFLVSHTAFQVVRPR
jgi:ketosteroid isomerase-like protein